MDNTKIDNPETLEERYQNLINDAREYAKKLANESRFMSGKDMMLEVDGPSFRKDEIIEKYGEDVYEKVLKENDYKNPFAKVRLACIYKEGVRVSRLLDIDYFILLEKECNNIPSYLDIKRNEFHLNAIPVDAKNREEYPQPKDKYDKYQDFLNDVKKNTEIFVENNLNITQENVKYGLSSIHWKEDELIEKYGEFAYHDLILRDNKNAWYDYDKDELIEKENLRGRLYLICPPIDFSGEKKETIIDLDYLISLYKEHGVACETGSDSMLRSINYIYINASKEKTEGRTR